MEKKNLLIVAANGLGRTGVPNVIFQVVEVLHDFLNIDIVVFNDDDYYAKALEKLGANIIKTKIVAPKSKLLRFIWRFTKERAFYRKTFNKIFKAKKYNVIHSFKEIESGYIFEIARRFDVEDMFVHCNNELKEPRNCFARYFYHKKVKLTQKYATQFIGVSNQCCKITYPGSKFVTVFNSYDENKFNKAVKCVLCNDELVLAHIGTFSSRKNQLFSIDLANSLSRKCSKFHLNLIGFERENGYLTKMKERIMELQLADVVSVIDGSSNVSEHFKNMSYLILPSISEAAPISLVEAQACGIKCFASSNVTRDVDCGGVVYTDLDCEKWASLILSTFMSEHNARHEYKVEKFSKYAFRNQMKKLYSKFIL